MGGGSPLWFGTVYIEMLLLTPFMNRLLENRGGTKKLLLILFVINVIPPTVLFRDDFFYSGEMVWFCFLYLLIGYIKKNHLAQKLKGSYCLCGAFGVYLILMLIYFSIEHISISNRTVGKLNETLHLSTYFIDRYHTLPVFVCSFLLFFFFQKLDIKESRLINCISEGCFGVYIFHQAPGFAKLLWFEIFKTQIWLNSSRYFVYYLMTVILIFLGGSLIDLARRNYIENFVLSSHLAKVLNDKLASFYSEL